MKICFRCGERPARRGYCKKCKHEYNRIWKSNHKKNPPKGMLKGNYRRAARDFPVPEVTMVYRSEGGVICGNDKTNLDFLGTSATVEGKEDRFFCPACKETLFVPHIIYPRLRFWAATPRFNGKRDNLHSGGNVALLLDLDV